MSKMESRISLFLAEESDSEQIDPMDEEVLTINYSFFLAQVLTTLSADHKHHNQLCFFLCILVPTNTCRFL